MCQRWRMPSYERIENKRVKLCRGPGARHKTNILTSGVIRQISRAAKLVPPARGPSLVPPACPASVAYLGVVVLVCFIGCIFRLHFLSVCIGFIFEFHMLISFWVDVVLPIHILEV